MNSYGTPSIEIKAVKPISPLKIGWVAERNMIAAQTRIRVINVCNALRMLGYKSDIVNFQDILEKNYDIAIVGKSFDENNYNNIKLLKQHGKIVYCDLCESILNFPWVSEIIKICDKIICCSCKLSEEVQTINSKTIVIEDAFET